MLSPAALTADPLRPLRGVRLAVELGFGLEPATRQVIASHAAAQVCGEASLPAWERVGEELGRIMMSDGAADGVALLAVLSLLEVYLPELAQTRGVEQRGFHHLDVFEHSLEALRQLLVRFPEADLSLRWAALLHDIGKPATKSYDETGCYYHFYGHDRLGSRLAHAALARLRTPHEVALRVAKLVRYHMLPLPKGEREARRFVHRRRDILPELLKLMIADREAARGPLASDLAREAYRLALARVLAIMAEPQPERPLFDGHEVMALLNLKPGPPVGQALRFIQEAQAVGDVCTREDAEAALRRYAQAQGWL
jgi:poly(A) polymerase